MNRARATAWRGAALTLSLFFGSWGTLEGQTMRGTVRDDRTDAPVVSALVQLGQTRHFAVSDQEGRFCLAFGGESGIRTLIVTAPGYAKRYHPSDTEGSVELDIRMAPQPLELEGLEASVLSYKARIRRRMNGFGVISYALEGSLLEESREDNIWELVGNRHGFYFEGYSDYGCPLASINGVRAPVDLFVDDLPVRFAVLDSKRPQDFAVVEIYEFGRTIRAYTQRYLDWMTENGKPATRFDYDMIPGLCPKQEPAPGTMKRGRPVGRSPSP